MDRWLPFGPGQEIQERSMSLEQWVVPECKKMLNKHDKRNLKQTKNAFQTKPHNYWGVSKGHRAN